MEKELMSYDNSEIFFNTIRDSLIGRSSFGTSPKTENKSELNQSSGSEGRWKFLIDAMRQDMMKHEKR